MIPKYRAWDKTDKEMYLVDEINFNRGEFESIGDGITFMRMADEIELMQSIGLKDKNGQEIFEGDVVTNGWKRQVVTFGTQEVEEDFGSIRIYRGFNLYLGGGYPNAIMSEFEVVGNIYENPDLLEVIK